LKGLSGLGALDQVSRNKDIKDKEKNKEKDKVKEGTGGNQ